jgi:hypothetical protein
MVKYIIMSPLESHKTLFSTESSIHMLAGNSGWFNTLVGTAICHRTSLLPDFPHYCNSNGKINLPEQATLVIN